MAGKSDLKEYCVHKAYAVQIIINSPARFIPNDIEIIRASLQESIAAYQLIPYIS